MDKKRALKTHEMIRELSERKVPFGELFFMNISDEDTPIFAFLRPSCGSIELRAFDIWNKSYIADNPIIYTSDTWVEVTKEKADVYLKGNYELI